MNTVWIVEHRDSRNESTIAHVASTRDKAIEFCKNNCDYDTLPYRWFIDENEVDNSDVLGSCRNGFYVDSNGVELQS